MKILRFFAAVFVLAVVFAGFAGGAFATSRDGNTNAAITDFDAQLEKGEVADVKMNGDNNLLCWRGTGNNFCAYAPPGFNSREFVKEMHEKGIKVEFIPPPKESVLSIFLGVFWVVFAIVVLTFFLFGRGGVIGEGGPGDALSKLFKSTAKLFSKDERKAITFADVAGCDEAKEEVKEIIDFLKEPEKFAKIGAKIPKGVLLAGKPGTGKTLLAKAVAGEAGVPFLSTAGSEFTQMYVGVGAARVRDLFDDAEKKAPCIIFIDEIDAMGRQRTSGPSNNEERETTLNQILTRMDGFSESDKPIIVIAATNRPDILDEALLRPGRFTRHIPIDAPDIKGREEILKIHVKNVTLGPDVKLSELAKDTPGFVGADLANLVNEAALYAARSGKEKAWKMDFEFAKDRVTMGLAKKTAISEKERKIIAYHEAGHALAAKFLEHADPVRKITIVSRGMALGATQYSPEDKRLYSKNYLLDQIAALLGGRIAEEIIFGEGEVTTGAENDLERAANIARKIVCDWGMSELGAVVYGEKGGGMFSPDGTRMKNYSESTALLIDETVADIVSGRKAVVKEMFLEKRKTLERLASALLEKETLGAEEVNEIMNYQEPNYYRVL